MLAEMISDKKLASLRAKAEAAQPGSYQLAEYMAQARPSEMLELLDEIVRLRKEKVAAAAVAWVEIHGAVLHCPCGHETDFTDSVRQRFCSRAVAQCARCKLMWETPAAADCELSSSTVEHVDGDE
jgi:hypothetical protein